MSDGAFLGLIAGLGWLAIWWSLWEQDGQEPHRGRLSDLMDRLRDDLVKVGLPTVPPAAVPALCAGLGLVVAAALWAVSIAVVPSLAFGALVMMLPVLLVGYVALGRYQAMIA